MRYESDGHIYIYIIHYFMYVFISAAIIEAREIESYVQSGRNVNQILVTSTQTNALRVYIVQVLN